MRASSVFVITYPFAHVRVVPKGLLHHAHTRRLSDVQDAQRRAMADQYRAVIRQAAAKRGSLVVGVGLGARTNPDIRALDRYARSRLGERWVSDIREPLAGFSVEQLAERAARRIAPLLGRKKTVALSGCGELADECAERVLDRMEKSLRSCKVKADYRSFSLVGSAVDPVAPARRGARARDYPATEPFYPAGVGRGVKTKRGPKSRAR